MASTSTPPAPSNATRLRSRKLAAIGAVIAAAGVAGAFGIAPSTGSAPASAAPASTHAAALPQATATVLSPAEAALVWSHSISEESGSSATP